MRSKSFFIWGMLLFAVVFQCGCGQYSANAEFSNVAVPVTATPPPSPDENARKTVIEGRELELIDVGGKCRLLSGDEEIDLELPAGCDFHRSPSMEVRSYPGDFVKDKKNVPAKFRGVSIVLVEHSVKEDLPSKDCRTQLQGIKIGKDNIVTSTSTTVASCPPYQWEEINYVGLFN